LLAVELEVGKPARSLSARQRRHERTKETRRKDTCALWNLRSLVLSWSRAYNTIKKDFETKQREKQRGKGGEGY